MDLVCVNHWSIAIESHRRMHPSAQHHCADLSTARPTAIVPGGHLDLLAASPTCTHHSRARGGRPTSDQQRMDPWHIIPWTTQLKVDRLLFENVVEFLDWGPVCPRTQKPIKSKKGTYFESWWATLHNLGYVGSFRKLNCADYGDATTRVRWFGQLRHKSLGKGGIQWPHPTHAREPAHNLLGPLQRWRSARECIDWSLPGTSIYDRKRRLSDKTLLRIYAGIVKFNWPARYQLRLRRYLEQLGIPVPSIRVVREIDLEPFILAQGEGSEGRPVRDPMATIPTGGAHALIAPYYGSGSGESAQSVDLPLPTATAKARFGLIVPITHSKGGNVPRSVGHPLPTLTTSKGGEFALAGPDDGDDILYRMLQPPELARATSFSDADRNYDFAGNKTEVTKQIGNAVPIRTARNLVRASLYDMAVAGHA
jgi:DNA (cytosine-5)-methyltransferase 1